MRQEDIDKKIGMPDVDAEWAKFEREVINQNTASRKPLYLGIGIAASIALVAGIFLFGHDAEESQKLLAQQTAQPLPAPVGEGSGVGSVSSTTPQSEELQTPPLTPPLEGRGVAAPPVVPLVAQDSIVPTSADLGPGNAMRLGGIRIAGSDTVRIGRKTDFDFLVVIDGQPLSEAEQKRMLSSGFQFFFSRQQIINSINIYKDEDAKRPYVEQYGERAKNAVMFITTAPDTLCDAYVQQHPELMQTRHRIEGYVIDKDTNEPLPDTWINCTWTTYKNVGDTWIKHTDGAGAATDSTGHFVLWPPRKDVKLQASRVGYMTVRIDQPADTTLTIRMTNATIIKDVKVVPKSTIRIRGNE